MGSSNSHEILIANIHEILTANIHEILTAKLQKTGQEKLCEQQLTRTERPSTPEHLEDEHDFLCMDYSSELTRMPCGHTVTAESLTDWCERQLEQGQSQFECGVCDQKWSFKDVSDIVPDKDESFDEQLFKNSFKDLQVKQCPGCKCYALRKNPRDLSVLCPRCTAQKGRRYEFCWQCLSEWKGRDRFGGRCENEGCTNEALEILRTCKDVEFEKVKGVTGCPSVRACPTCGRLVEHSGEKCKYVVCPNPDCKKEFCFVCLKLSEECKKKSSYYDPCSDGVAPRQASIAVRGRP